MIAGAGIPDHTSSGPVNAQFALAMPKTHRRSKFDEPVASGSGLIRWGLPWTVNDAGLVFGGGRNGSCRFRGCRWARTGPCSVGRAVGHTGGGGRCFGLPRGLAAGGARLCGGLLLRGKRDFVQEANRHFRSCLHGLRQSPEDPNGIVPDQIGSTERGPSASRPRLRERRGGPGGEGSDGNVAERNSKTLLFRSGHDRGRLPALLAMKRR